MDTITLSEDLDDEIMWIIFEQEKEKEREKKKEKEKRYNEYGLLIQKINTLFKELVQTKDNPKKREEIVDYRNELIAQANVMKEKYNF